MLSLYSFPDSLSEEAKANGVRQATSVDESNDELDSLHTITVIHPKSLVGRKSFFCGEAVVIFSFYFNVLGRSG